mmetsp:Transcript_17421/g.50731  ORF Transcript_17421/g.50731 Transcript_17421/m.50731 type:complete len:290 (-) Transcript_17421:767-1636(-)
MLGLPQYSIDRLDDGRFLIHGSEIVIEHGPSDDIEGDRTEPFLHVDPAGRGGRGADGEVVDEAISAVGEERDHSIEPFFVKSGDDGAASDLPSLGIGGDQSLPHDGLQYLRQHPLAILLGGALPQNLPCHDGIAHDQKTLGTEAQIEDGAVILIIFRQEEKQRSTRQGLEISPQHSPYEREERSLVLLNDRVRYRRHSEIRTESQLSQNVHREQIRRIDDSHGFRGGIQTRIGSDVGKSRPIHQKIEHAVPPYPRPVVLPTQSGGVPTQFFDLPIESSLLGRVVPRVQQ